MLKVAILDDYQNVSQEFVDLKKLSGKYEFKIFKISKLAFVIIIMTPKNESITPIIWNIFVFSIFKIDEKNIIITGIVEIIKTPLITCVKFNE